MPGIHADFGTVSKRRQAIEKLFKPLTRNNRVEIFENRTSNQVAYGLGQKNNSLRLARHPTRIDKIFVNYFEIWKLDKRPTEYQLLKAYLHVDKPNLDGTGDDELLALHSDPEIVATTPESVYKRGPHLHFSSAKTNISKSHVALCLTDLDRVCTSLDAFNNALRLAVEMINAEFFDRF